NKWSNSMPAAIGGKWYIYYKGSYPWSHFEAPAAKRGAESNFTAEIAVFPNPAGQVLYIRSSEGVYHLQIVDFTGRILKTQSSTAPNCEVNLTDIPAGCYVLKIISQKFVYSKQLIKQ
ncbi:MAG: T9SS type A sorting domain-containing protein, partial [Bacteroidales bacterium]